MVDKTFEKMEYAAFGGEGDEFEACRFQGCEFSSAGLGGTLFSGCRFESCNLSLAVMKGATLKDVVFSHCKLMGIDFSACNKFLFSPSFHHCMMHYTLFAALNLRKMRFEHCDLREADFSGSDLSGAVFEACDLPGTVFYRTLLENADLSTARYYSIDPEQNSIRGAHFSLPGVVGLLDKYGIRIDYTG